MQIKGCVLAGLSVALVAGCASRADYKRPTIDAPGTYRDATAASTSDPKTYGDLGWWEVYSEPLLAKLIATAVDRNRDIKIATARVAEARANLGVAEYGPLPSINFNAGASRSRVSSVGATPLPNQAAVGRRVWRATIDASYEVDFWGRIDSLTIASRADLLTLDAARDVVMATLVGDLATTYFDLLSLDQQLAITQRTIDTRQRFLHLSETRLRLGAGTRVDVDRARANLNAVQALVPDLKRRATQAENLIAFVSGGFPGSVERARKDVESLPAPPNVPVGLPSALLERRPDVRQAESAIVASNARLAAQRAALLPSFSLNAQYGSEAGPIGRFLTVPSLIWSIGPSILMPILNVQRNRFLVDAQAAREVQAIEQYQKVVEQSVREVADALVAQREFSEVRAVQAEQVAALREVVRLTTRRYEVGIASLFEVVDAQRELLNAELSLAQAQRNALIASVQLYKALGGGWQRDIAATPAASSAANVASVTTAATAPAPVPTVIPSTNLATDPTAVK